MGVHCIVVVEVQEISDDVVALLPKRPNSPIPKRPIVAVSSNKVSYVIFKSLHLHVASKFSIAFAYASMISTPPTF